jgi:hypothetical protein
MLALRQNLTTAIVADFGSGSLNACGQVNRSQTQLESELAYWEAELKNCSGVPEVCADAKERIANVTARIDALTPSIQFCADFVPGLVQALHQLDALVFDLQQLANGLELYLQNPLRYVATALTRYCATLASPSFLLGLTAVLSTLNENVSTDALHHNICIIETVPC